MITQQIKKQFLALAGALNGDKIGDDPELKRFSELSPGKQHRAEWSALEKKIGRRVEMPEIDKWINPINFPEQHQAALQEELGERLKALAANLLRVVRGSGASELLLDQMAWVLSTAKIYQEDLGEQISPLFLKEALALASLRERLASDMPEYTRREESGELAKDDAIHEIARASLQMVAAKLVGPKAHYSAGRNGICGGAVTLRRILQGRGRS